MTLLSKIRCQVMVLAALCTGIATAQTKVSLTLQWSAQAQFTGYYVAQAKGFYREAGLDVSITHPSTSKSSVEYLRSGQCQFATMQLLMAMKEIGKGLKIINVLQTSQQNGAVIVSREPLKGLHSLRGKKIGHWKAGYSELPMAIDKHYKLDIEWIPFLSHINLYISGAIDASLVMIYNEYIQLEMAGQRIKDNQRLYLRNIGYNIPEDGLYVTEDYYHKNKELVEKFAKATRRGWEWAIANPKEALDIVMQTLREEGNASNVVMQQRMMNECFELMKDSKGQRTYTLDPRALTVANRLLVETGFIKKNISYKQITGQ